MNSQAIFDALNDSQDNSPLRRWILRNRPHDLHWSFTDALNALLVFAWRDAEDADELEGHLMYAQRQIAAALLSVQREHGGRTGGRPIARGTPMTSPGWQG